MDQSRGNIVKGGKFPRRFRFPFLILADGTPWTVMSMSAKKKILKRKMWNSLTSPEATASPGMKSSG